MCVCVCVYTSMCVWATLQSSSVSLSVACVVTTDPVCFSSFGCFLFSIYPTLPWKCHHYITLRHTYTESHVKRWRLTGWSAGQSAVLIIGPGEVGGAAAVIRAFWCGLAERKGHPLNISGRTTCREGRGQLCDGTVHKHDDHIGRAMCI